MVDPEIVIVPFVFGIPAAVILSKIYFKHVERMAELKRGSAPTSEMSQRLERVEQSVESIAIEMERIGEGQRFVTKLLSEKSSADKQA